MQMPNQKNLEWLLMEIENLQKKCMENLPDVEKAYRMTVANAQANKIAVVEVEKIL